jgi:hypothetical protein
MAAIGFSVTSVALSSDDDRGRDVEASGVTLLPDESLADWVTYADAVVTVQAVSERKLAESAEESAAGEGLSVRMVTLQVDKVLWAAEGSDPIPTTFEIPHGGWIFHGKEEARLLLEDSVALELGHTFVVPIYLDESFDNEWQALSPRTIIPFDSERVGKGADEDASRFAAASEATRVQSLAPGLSKADVQRRLSSVKADPLAEKHPSLTHRALYEAILQDANTAQKPDDR